jgi:hypothetical protein
MAHPRPAGSDRWPNGFTHEDETPTSDASDPPNGFGLWPKTSTILRDEKPPFAMAIEAGRQLRFIATYSKA